VDGISMTLLTLVVAFGLMACDDQGSARQSEGSAPDGAVPTIEDAATAQDDGGPPGDAVATDPAVDSSLTPVAAQLDGGAPTKVADASPLPAPDAAPTRPAKAVADAGKAPLKTPTKTPEPAPPTKTPEQDASVASIDGGSAPSTGDGGDSKISDEVRTLTSLVAKAYSAAKGFEADFEQTYRNRLLERETKSRGHVWLRPPTRMRWEYTAPTKNLIVADGRNLFVHEPDDNQVIRMPVGDSELPAVMAFLTGGRDLNEDYHVHLVAANVAKSLSDRGQAGLDLRPRRPSSVVERVVLVIARDTGRVQKTVLVEPEGNTNTFLWSKVQTDDHIPDSRFTFTPPPGANITERGR
jgi:outer membrane lipoprotein carrier protein